MKHRICVDERGVMGGAESLLFSVLIFVFGSIILINVWAVLFTKMTAQNAASEAANAYVSQGSQSQAWSAAHISFRNSVSNGDPDATNFGTIKINNASFARCSRVTIRVELPVTRARVSLLRVAIVPVRVSSSSSKVVDPYRAGVQGEIQSDSPCRS